MTVTPLDKDYAKLLLPALWASEESRVLEFKRVSGKMVSKALETVCAFANTDGGVLVLGMADMRDAQGKERLFGVEENAEAVDELQRKLATEFEPRLETVSLRRLECQLHAGPANGRRGHLLLVYVVRSKHVHSLKQGGTFGRLDRSNAQLSAADIVQLSYRRGDRSAASEPVPVPLERLQTDAWRRFLERRGPLTGQFHEQLLNIGLAVEVDGAVQPLRAAVLLFANEPGSLLAAQGTRADLRIFVYDGKSMVDGATPNLRKAPKTIRGPLIDQIDRAVAAVMDELAEGVTLSSSGFKTRHLYPERVVKEAIVNAVVHRDYRLNRVLPR